MTPNTYEKEIAIFDKYPESSKPMCYALGLAGESGEVCDKFKKIIRDKKGKFEKDDQDILKELGDVLWYATRCANYFGFSLEDIITMNYLKLKDRNERGVIGGSGDER